MEMIIRNLRAWSILTPTLLTLGCDALHHGVRNATRERISVEYAFKDGADCGGSGSVINLLPGMRTATVCPASDLDHVVVRTARTRCKIPVKTLTARSDDDYVFTGCPIR